MFSKKKEINLYNILRFVIVTHLFGNSENSEVRLKPSKEIPSFTILQNEPLNIVFENFNATRQSPWCWKAGPDHDMNIDPNKLPFHNYGNGTSILTINNVTFSMSARWECSLNDKPVLFDVRVKGAKRIPIYVNGNEKALSATDQSELVYDAGYTIFFNEGDITVVVCSLNIREDKIRLRYCDAKDNEVIRTEEFKRDKQLTFRQLMRAENNGSYVDCTYTTTIMVNQPIQEFTYRIIFKINSTRRYDFKNIAQSKVFEKGDVNDTYILGLPTRGILYQFNKSPWKWETHYEYEDNESLDLRCWFPKSKTLQWNSGRAKELQPAFETLGEFKYIKRTFSLNSANNATEISCVAKEIGKINIITTIILHLKPETTSSDGSDIVENANYVEDNPSMEMFVGGAFCGLLIAIIAGVCCFYWYKRIPYMDARRIAMESNSQSNAIPKFPSQWETYDYAYSHNTKSNEYTYIKNDENIMFENSLYCSNASLYAVPQKRHTQRHTQRHTEISNPKNPIENHYTEIDLLNKNDGINYPLPYESTTVKSVPSTSQNNYSY